MASIRNFKQGAAHLGGNAFGLGERPLVGADALLDLVPMGNGDLPHVWSSGHGHAAARWPVLNTMPGWAALASPSRTKRSISSVTVVPSAAPAAPGRCRSPSSRRTLVVDRAIVISVGLS